MKRSWRKALILILSACFAVTIGLSAAACDEESETEHTLHTDANGDGFCDECNAPLEEDGGNKGGDDNSDGNNGSNDGNEPHGGNEPDGGENGGNGDVNGGNGDENGGGEPADPQPVGPVFEHTDANKDGICDDCRAELYFDEGTQLANYTFSSITTGETYTLGELCSQYKLVYLNFFYVGCYFCEVELPSIVEVYPEYAEDMIYIFLDIYASGTDSDQKIIDWAEDYNVDSFFVGRDQFLFNRLAPNQGAPVSIFIDSNAVIVYKHFGAIYETVDGINQYTPAAVRAVFEEAYYRAGYLTFSAQYPVALPAKRED